MAQVAESMVKEPLASVPLVAWSPMASLGFSTAVVMAQVSVAPGWRVPRKAGPPMTTLASPASSRRVGAVSANWGPQVTSPSLEGSQRRAQVSMRVPASAQRPEPVRERPLAVRVRASHATGMGPRRFGLSLRSRWVRDDSRPRDSVTVVPERLLPLRSSRVRRKPDTVAPCQVEVRKSCAGACSTRSKAPLGWGKGGSALLALSRRWGKEPAPPVPPPGPSKVQTPPLRVGAGRSSPATEPMRTCRPRKSPATTPACAKGGTAPRSLVVTPKLTLFPSVS